MRKPYAKPMIEIEAYKLSASIAYNCKNIINVGPGIPGAPAGDEYAQCSDYGDSGFLYSIKPGISLQSNNKPFYEDGLADCDCYYSSGNSGFFTS